MIKFLKRFFHVCHEFEWNYGFGLIPMFGLGGYQFESCKECPKITGRIKNFEPERSLK
jgi:hypothetical protein